MEAPGAPHMASVLTFQGLSWPHLVPIAKTWQGVPLKLRPAPTLAPAPEGLRWRRAGGLPGTAAGLGIAHGMLCRHRGRRGPASPTGARVSAAAAATAVSAAVAPLRRPLQRGRVSAALPVPPHIPRPPYVAEPEKVRGWWNSRIESKSPEAIAAMRTAGHLAHSALDLAGSLIVPGRTTEAIEFELHHFICGAGAYPSDLGYKGFPKSIMISVNEVICHGIPDDRPLEKGDLVNVDVTLFHDGFHADTARTWVCGETDGTGMRLVDATREALDAAISVSRAGVPMRVIGDAVSNVAEREGFGVVKTLVGHGIGEFFHGVPQIYHCRNSDNRKMQEGMTFTIEPVLTEGSPDWFTWDDGWTVATSDGGRAAQFEHTLLITADGCEVLT